MTIHELCMQHAGADSHSRFHKDRYVDFKKFDEFISSRNRSGFSSDMLWEEFRGVIKGCYFLTKDLTRSSISLAEYQDLNRIGLSKDFDALFAVEDRATIHKLFNLYQNWLKQETLWDDLDLSRQALLNVRTQYPHGRYDQVIVDEVQDLTIYQVQLLLSLAKNPEGVFLAGDVHQSIYPSRFRWERLKQQVYEFYNAKYTPMLSVIDKNYRSVRPIVNICNTIARFRHATV
jgi:superfamily I DNA/RNA helicase